MKNYLPLTVLGLALASKSLAAPFLAIGDGAELFVTGALAVRADDNIFLSVNDEDDVIFEVAPGAELVFGKGAQVQGRLSVVDAFTFYQDNDGLNSNLFSTDLNANYDDGKLKAGTALSYRELNQNTADIRGLTRRDVFSASVNAEVNVSDLSSVGSGVSFANEDYKRTGYGDSDTLTVPVNVYYKATPKADLSLGYRFRDYETTLGSDSTDHFFNLGARGQFTPKLSGTFAVGYNTRNVSGGDQSDLGFDGSFNLELTPKTAAQIGLSRDFGTSPQGQQQLNSSVNVRFTSRINELISAFAGGTYRNIEYSTRTDDYLEGTIGGGYVFNSTASVNLSYTYRKYISDIGSAEFSNHVFAVSTSLRY